MIYIAFAQKLLYNHWVRKIEIYRETLLNVVVHRGHGRLQGQMRRLDFRVICEATNDKKMA